VFEFAIIIFDVSTFTTLAGSVCLFGWWITLLLGYLLIRTSSSLVSLHRKPVIWISFVLLFSYSTYDCTTYDYNDNDNDNEAYFPLWVGWGVLGLFFFLASLCNFLMP
jgi:hypothetical protein